jgi:hypothetical protein
MSMNPVPDIIVEASPVLQEDASVSREGAMAQRSGRRIEDIPFGRRTPFDQGTSPP